jgi:hypothetical protein
MKKLLTLALAALIGSATFAQDSTNSVVIKSKEGGRGSDIQTLLANRQPDGFYFAFNSKFSHFDKDFGVMLGGSMAWVINRSLGIGIVGYGLASEVRTTKLIPDESLQLEMGYGGILVEPILFSNKVMHVTFPTLFGAGGVAYFHNNRLDYDDYDYEDADAFFVSEPGVSMELNLTKALRFNIGGSYRFMSSLDLSDLPDPKLNGFSINAALKIGLF